MIDELITWLRVQLDEDIEIAPDIHENNYCGKLNDPYDPCDCPWPERTRREVEAKRRIIDELSKVLDTASPNFTVESCDELEAILAEKILRLVALPYADREGYRDEWRP